MDNINEQICSKCGATLTAFGYCVICINKGVSYLPIVPYTKEDIERDAKFSEFAKTLVESQPDPIKNDNPAIWDLVIEEMKNRDNVGLKRYGTRLQPFNGRDSLQDLKEELLDAVAYITQLIYERDHKKQ